MNLGAEEIKPEASPGRRKQLAGILLSLATVLVVIICISLLDLSPDLSHIRVKLFTGSSAGHYHKLGVQIEDKAKQLGARIGLKTTGQVRVLLRPAPANVRPCD